MEPNLLGGPMKEFDLTIDGEKIKVRAMKAKGQLWYHYRGETRSLELKTKGHGGSSSVQSSEPGVLKAPMPGKVTKINVAPNQAVEAGDVLIVMEAMKMEYSIEADISGVIEKVNANEEQQVALGDTLVTVKAASEKD